MDLKFQYLMDLKFHILPADHFIAIVFLSQNTKTWFNHTTTQPQDKMKCGLYKIKKTNVCLYYITTVSNLSLKIRRPELSILKLPYGFFSPKEWSAGQEKIFQGETKLDLDHCMYVFSF